MDLTALGKTLILVALVLGVVGLLLVVGPRVPFLGWLGRLPGDLSFGTENVRVYLPLGTSIVLSLLLTLALLLITRLGR